MNKLNKVLQTLFCTVILVSGIFLFTQQDANAFRTCDDRSYEGNYNMHDDDCWVAEPINCYTCVATPLEEIEPNP